MPLAIYVYTNISKRKDYCYLFPDVLWSTVQVGFTPFHSGLVCPVHLWKSKKKPFVSSIVASSGFCFSQLIPYEALASGIVSMLASIQCEDVASA